MNFTTIWSFLLVLSGLIFVHELGHFLVARRFGIRVLKFSIGFGPRVWGVVKGYTDYCISAFPLGGFVKMLGENPDEVTDVSASDLKHSFSHKPTYQKAAVVAAGPFSNLIFAWFIILAILLIYGNPKLLPVIGDIKTGSPAEKAGILNGDLIVSINNKSVAEWEDAAGIIKASEGKTIEIELKRGQETFKVAVLPELQSLKNIFGEEVKTPVVGITAKGEVEIEKLGFLSALKLSATRTWDMIELTIQGFVKLFQRVVPLSSLGGPIMIAQMAGQQAELGMVNLFFFMAILSINLGILNLLPVPILDGGHLVFYAIEAVRGEPLSLKQMELAQKVGMVLLGCLMLIVFYNDIMRVLGFAPSILPAP